MINRAVFFRTVRTNPFGGFLDQSQVDGMNNILDEAERRAWPDKRWLAYCLATAFHETGRKMQPVREGGGDAYLKARPYFPWVGEGLVQVTWEVNARKFGATKPGDCMSWPVALNALFDGMAKGMFTGRKLADYFNPSVDDPRSARRIVNGTDHAVTIAGYHAAFLAALNAAATATARPAEPAKPVPPVIAGPHILPKPKTTPAKTGAKVGAVVVAAGAAAGAAYAPHGGVWMAGLVVVAIVALGVAAAIHWHK